MQKQQTIHFVNDEGDKTATINMVLCRQIDSFPISRQLIFHQQTATMFASLVMWKTWKSKPTPEHQMKYLTRHAWTYEDGKLPERYDEKFKKILLLQ